jgi:ubiquinone/menaquinone biosynthesis C-methylase UbiE
MNSSRWQDVDDTASPDTFVGYLDRAAALLRETRLATVRALEVTPGCSVLDVGSGAGEFLIELATTVENVRAIGIDTSRAMVETATSRAQAAGAAVQFVFGDAEHLDFPDASFDRVNCSRVLVHLERPRTSVEEMARVLAPGGRLYLFEPDFDALMIDSDDLATATAVRNALTAGLRNPDIGRRLRRFALDAGLELVDFSGSVRTQTNLQIAIDQFHLLEHLETAVATAALSRETASRWRQWVEASDASARFLVAGVAFSVLAKKPAP